MNPFVNKTMLKAAVLGGMLMLWPLKASGRMPSATGAIFQQIEQNWYELSPRERSRALENYNRFQKLPPERQRDIRERYNRWQQLPSEEKNRIRENYRRYRGMNSDEKEEFNRKYRRWRSEPRN